ncbi:MAG: glycosyltransferase family 39 protein [Candidatus Eremiobacteraeota bacterium]|nr:glycosyltransferase family 39 protein [Candidatus Eremiobacteraeota bacterium]
MMRIKRHEEAEFYALFDGRVHPSDDLLAIDRLAPQRGIAATFSSLREEPQRGPLFYLVARLWARLAGDGVVAMRALPALLGIAGIAFAFVLGRRVAGGLTGGAILAALVAVSPIELHLARQLREYGAIADTVLASAWLLLRAFERRSIGRWCAYGASVLVGLFVSPIFGAVAIAHAIVAAYAARRDGRRVFLGWLASVAVAGAIFAPWLVANLGMARAHAGDLSWLHGAYAPRAYALKWAFNIGAVFFDSEFARVRLGLVLVPILAIVALSFYAACTVAYDPVARVLALATTLCSLVPLVLLDIVTHAHFESVTRYQMATWVGIDILVALALTQALAAPSRRRIAAASALGFLVICGAFSAAFDRAYPVWWDDNEHLDERLVGRVVAAAGAPALVVATKDGEAAPHALVLAHYLPPGTGMLLYGATLPPLPPAPRDVFLFIPTQNVVREVKARVAPARDVRNGSPPLGLSIPDLRSESDAQASAAIRADNALWHVVSTSPT